MPITYDRKRFFDAVRVSIFHGALTASQVAGMTAILDGWEKLQPAGDPRFVAYMLGTAKWETASTMQPIEEYGHGRGRAYGVPAGPYGQIYYGRGFVQLTWLSGYQKAETELRSRYGLLTADESLVRTPALAMRADVAAAIMLYGMVKGWFTGKTLADYFNGVATDWTNARRIINGTDHAADVGLLAQRFHAALTAALIRTPAAAVAQVEALADARAHNVPPSTATPAAPAPASPTAAPPAGLFARIASLFG